MFLNIFKQLTEACFSNSKNTINNKKHNNQQQKHLKTIKNIKKINYLRFK